MLITSNSKFLPTHFARLYELEARDMEWVYVFGFNQLLVSKPVVLSQPLSSGGQKKLHIKQLIM